MNISIDLLMNAFSIYNPSIWPMQIVAYVLCLVALVPLIRSSRITNRLTTGIMVFFWLWIGLMFWLPFRETFAPAIFLAVVFAVQGILFALAMFRQQLEFRFNKDIMSYAGIIAIVYALVYPLIGLPLGHRYPQMALSTIFPCPLIVFTFGLLLINRRKTPIYLLIIPFIWAVSGALWVSLGMLEDIGLVLTGILGTWLILRRDRRALTAERAHEAANPAA
jgi:hypothetical protein